VKGAVGEQHETCGGMLSDRDDMSIEWVVGDASKVQIYGLLFCFFSLLTVSIYKSKILQIKPINKC